METKEKEFYAERLEALWGRYVAFVNFVVTISGGTVLVLITKLVELRIAEKPVVSTVPPLIWCAFGFAAFSAIYSIFWRALAQRYMEYEILAPFGNISKYIGEDGDKYTVTNPHRFEKRHAVFRFLYKLAYKFAPWAIGVALLTSWVLIGLHLRTVL